MIIKSLIILIIIFFFIILMNNCYLESFSDDSINDLPNKSDTDLPLDLNKKRIFSIWRNKINNTNTNKLDNESFGIRNNYNHGIGDKLRGIITLHQYCLKNNIELIVDGTDDGLSYFFKNINTKYYDYIKDKEVIKYTSDLTINILFSEIDSLFVNNNELYLYNNCVPEEVSIENKIFMKTLLEPTDEFQLELYKHINNIPINYTIKHFRFDDSIFMNMDIDENNPILMEYFEILKKNYVNTDILITNSKNFKKYAVNKLNINTIECENESCVLSHVGALSDYEMNKQTMIEFFVISKSKSIQTHSHYPWISGFVRWVSAIYDIPLQQI